MIFLPLIKKLKALKFTLRFCVVAILILFFLIALLISFPIIYYRMNEDLSNFAFQ